MTSAYFSFLRQKADSFKIADCLEFDMHKL